MVHVFKTSVKTRAHVRQLMPLLDSLVLPEGRWNFDLDDIDKILRIEGCDIMIDSVERALVGKGFVCEALI